MTCPWCAERVPIVTTSVDPLGRWTQWHQPEPAEPLHPCENLAMTALVSAYRDATGGTAR